MQHSNSARNAEYIANVLISGIPPTPIHPMLEALSKEILELQDARDRCNTMIAKCVEKEHEVINSGPEDDDDNSNTIDSLAGAAAIIQARDRATTIRRKDV